MVTYTFSVLNTGNVTLHGLSVVDTPTDPAGDVSVTCPKADLAPDKVATCSGTYSVTQDDLDHGRVRPEDEAAFNARITTANERFHAVIHRGADNDRLIRMLEDLQAYFPKDYVWRAIGDAAQEHEDAS